MTLEKNMNIAGIPALKIRDILKKYSEYSYGIDESWFSRLADTYNIKSSEIIDALLERGYIEEKTEQNKRFNEVCYSLTPLGSQFAIAKAIKRKDRKIVEKILSELLERVFFVNAANTIFLTEITSVVIFGSYLDVSRETLGDLDLVFYTRKKNIDTENILEKYRKKHRVWTFLKWEFQEEDKALRFIKAKNPFISIQEECDLNIPNLKFKEIYNIDNAEHTGLIEELFKKESIIKGFKTLEI